MCFIVQEDALALPHSLLLYLALYGWSILFKELWKFWWWTVWHAGSQIVGETMTDDTQMMEQLVFVALYNQQDLVICFLTPSPTHAGTHTHVTSIAADRHTTTLSRLVSLAALSASVTVASLHFTEPIEAHWSTQTCDQTHTHILRVIVGFLPGASMWLDKACLAGQLRFILCLRIQSQPHNKHGFNSSGGSHFLTVTSPGKDRRENPSHIKEVSHVHMWELPCTTTGFSWGTSQAAFPSPLEMRKS